MSASSIRSFSIVEVEAALSRALSELTGQPCEVAIDELVFVERSAVEQVITPDAERIRVRLSAAFTPEPALPE